MTGLDAEQERVTKEIFAAMEANAIKLGRRLVDEERELDRLFATRQITSELLGQSLERIGALQAKLRAAHLEAHLVQAAVLSPEQTTRYNTLRGYAAASSPSPKHSGHHH